MAHLFAQRTTTPQAGRRPRRHDDEHDAPTPAPHALIQLQQAIGNSGVRALLARSASPAVQRASAIQRFWGDEEDGDSGGSWLDDAVDTVTGWLDGGETTADASDSPASQETGGSPSEHSGSEKSWWDEATDEVSSWFDSDESSAESGVAEDEGGGFWDWLPEITLPSISGDEADEDMPTGEIELGEIETVVEGLEPGTASCVTGHGEAAGGGVSVAGLTSADFANATANASLQNASVAERKAGDKTVYDVTGKVHIDYALPGEPTVSYNINPPKSQLTECKREKVDAYIAGDLGAHEAEHVAAFKTFNGSEDHAVSFTGIEASSTEELTAKIQAKVDDFVKGPNGKVKARQAAAKAASDAKDPWSKPIPGITECK
jgi:hypothetical protein